MAPSKWDEDESDSTPPSSPPPRAIPKRGGKFDDEEDDSDVLESWDAEEDSEVEREKAKKAEEAKAKAEAEAKANKKSKSQRIEEHRMANLRRKQQEEEESSEEEEDEVSRKQREKRLEKEADMRNAADLFSGGAARPTKGEKHIMTEDPNDPSQKVDLSALKIFQPTTREQFVTLRETLSPLINTNSKKPQYATFLQDFSKTLCADMTSDQVKKVASSLTALSNEKMKEEKAADKGAKKTKAAKTKTTLNAGRDTVKQADTTSYDDGLGDDDFM